ncbi:TPM domain-containing protein [Novosphingobium sp. B 225]|uniref:TPM domain-containing protein n=1 Tax=Novosphingobium sp. B 225 TaxID=1961849 RepID=UPI000B4A640B|nr:TPM domain-containing protein [Novosphingobium sp. B 225]
MRLLMLCWLAILTLVGSPAYAALPARPNGPILDAAAIIPDDQEAALAQKLIAYNKATGRAIVVATVPALDGQVVERYAQDLAQAWGIGGVESQEGILFLIAPAERKIRIHAAVGAQGRVTDAFSGRTIRELVSPRFKAGDIGGGINAGVDALIAQMNRDPTDAKAVAEAAAAAEAARQSGSQSGGDSAGSVVFWLFLMLFFMFAFGRRGRRFGRRSGIDPGIVLWGISEAMRGSGRDGGWSGGGGFGGGDSGGSDWGGFGGGGGGFDGGGASGDW